MAHTRRFTGDTHARETRRLIIGTICGGTKTPIMAMSHNNELKRPTFNALNSRLAEHPLYCSFGQVHMKHPRLSDHH
jgi:hypothetical protein